jgi:hypothetical protein
MASQSPKLELETSVACAREGIFDPIVATSATPIVVTMGTATEAIEGRGAFIDDFIDVPLPLAIIGGCFIHTEKMADRDQTLHS